VFSLKKLLDRDRAAQSTISYSTACTSIILIMLGAGRDFSCQPQYPHPQHHKRLIYRRMTTIILPSARAECRHSSCGKRDLVAMGQSGCSHNDGLHVSGTPCNLPSTVLYCCTPTAAKYRRMHGNAVDLVRVELSDQDHGQRQHPVQHMKRTRPRIELGRHQATVASTSHGRGGPLIDTGQK
jgi:hypothetical protein